MYLKPLVVIGILASLLAATPTASPGSPEEIRAAIQTSDYNTALGLVEAELQQSDDPDSRAELIDLLIETLAGLQQDDARVDSLATWAIDQKSAAQGPGSTGAAWTRFQYARWLDYRVRYPEALDQCETAIVIYQAHEKAWRELARCLDLRMLILEKQGDLDGAADSGSEALSIWETHGEAESLEAGHTLGHIARTENRRGNPERARELYERTLVILSAHEDVTKPDLAVVHNNLSNILRELDDLDEATWEAEIALDLYREGLGPEHPRVALAIGNIANIKIVQGEYAEAESLYTEGLALSERALGPDHRQCGVFLFNLGRLQHAMGDEPAAQASFARALEIFEATLGPQHPFVSLVIGTRADVWIAEGNFVQAAEAAETSLVIKRAALGDDHPNLAATLRTLARARIGLGDYPAAGEALVESRYLTLEHFGTDHSEYAALLRVEAELADAQDRFAEAARARAEAERILVATTGGFTVEVADLRRERAVALARQGELDQAAALLDSNLSRQREEHGPEHPLIGSTLRAQGAIALRAGNPDAAVADLSQALEFYRNRYGVHPLVAATMADLAIAELQAGQPKRALELALDAQELSREVTLVALRGLGERPALLYAERQQRYLDLLLSLDTRNAGSIAEVWSAVAAMRGLVTEELSLRYRYARSSSTPEVQEAWASLDRARTRLAQLYVQGQADREEAEYTYGLAAARSAKEEAERALARAGAGVPTGTAEPGDFLEAIGDDRLVAYVQYRKLDVEDPSVLLDRQGGELRYAAFEADGTGTRRIEIGSAAEVGAAVHSWRRLAGTPPSVLPQIAAEAAEKTARAGAGLRRLVLDPVLGDDSRGRTLMVLDGALYLVNPGALPDREGKALFEAGPEFQLVGSESDVLVPTDRALPATGLVLGNPAFDAREAPTQIADAGLRSATPDCSEFERTKFPPLPGSAQEVDAVRDSWEASGIEPTVLTGANASETRLRDAVQGMGILHLATHAFFLGDECEDGTGVARDNPLLLSGLVLAGANLRQEGLAGSDDGILSAEELSSFDLRTTRWAVLSACQTGEGSVQRGEGVFGLRRAFRLAGCEGMVMTLWPVDDAATERWMELFYASFPGSGVDASAAVRKASLALRDERAARGESVHPFYWAGFVYSGAR